MAPALARTSACSRGRRAAKVSLLLCKPGPAHSTAISALVLHREPCSLHIELSLQPRQGAIFCVVVQVMVEPKDLSVKHRG